MRRVTREAVKMEFSRRHVPTCCCGGRGFVVFALSETHPLFGVAIPCACKREEIANRIAEQMQSMSGLAPETLEEWTFDTFDPDRCVPFAKSDTRAMMAACVRLCRQYAEYPQGWLVLEGAFGSGKTHLAYAIAAARVDRGVFASTVPDLLDTLRAGYASDAEMDFTRRFEAIKNVPMLVLDDLGSENGTTYAEEKLYQLVNHRYERRMPLVVTTNRRVDEIKGRLGSRLRQGSKVKGKGRFVKVLTLMAGDYRPFKEEEDVA